MSSLSRELVFLILQFLDEEKFNETVHRLEKESGFFFNMRYFEEVVTNGEWDDVEKYLSGFTKLEDNRYSMKTFFEIRKQKYLETLDKQDNPKALEILTKDLKVFSTFNEEIFKEITLLLTLTNFRENEQLSKYGDMKSARAIMFGELKKLIEANPIFRDKLHFPNLKNSRLRTLINQSLNWQHQLCKSPKSNPDIKTLFVDHTCGQANGGRAPSPVTNQLMGGGPSGMPKVGGFPQTATHNVFQPAPGPLNASLGGWMAGPSSASHQAISGGPLGLVPPNITEPMLKRSAMHYQTADSELALKRARLLGISEEGNNVPVNILPVTYAGPSHAQSLYSADDLPKTVIANLNQGSGVKSLDFHPGQQTLLLVGTNMGDIAIWEIAIRERLVYRNFKVRELGVCTPALQASLANEYTASVNRVVWSPDGILLGVAYSKNIVHMYSYHGGNDLRDHLEIDAHIGNVSDLAFAHPNKTLSIVTCGEDKTIKVWDAATGNKQYTFEGHEAPVYSVCPHFKENIQFIFSTGIDGKIKAWLYDDMGSRVDYDAPGQSCTRMGYSSDGLRLFSCGTSKDGESYIVEWNETEGAVKRTYLGLGKRTVGVVQFDTTKNRFLAAGDEFAIKFWDMDNVNLLMTIDAEGGLPASPCIQFNKEGFLLAVSTIENGVKILGNADSAHLLRVIENRVVDASRPGSSVIVKTPKISTYGASSSSAVGTSLPVTAINSLNGDGRSLSEVIPRTNEEVENSKIWKPKEITEPTQLRWLKLPDNMLPVRMVRLMYTHSGGAILGLAYNAVHKLWRWPRNERNTAGKATMSVPPVLCQPSSGMIMTNDISDANVENSVPCFAISKNDSYIMSASGGKICLFNLVTFKTMTTFMPPPPTTTFLAFHPIDNNVIAIGMDDSSIQIYNARVDEVKTKLKGHQKRVTGLAFSTVLNILVSAGVDARLCVWSIDSWEKQTCKLLQIPSGHKSTPSPQTRVHFHQDQKQLLVIHETHLAIYEAPNLDCIKQWVVREGNALITDATYSCDGQSIFASFEDGTVNIFTSPALTIRCRISPMAYLASNVSSNVYPLAITANPVLQNQLALGLSDGSVIVLEPLEAEGKWGTVPPQENGVGPSSNGVAANPSNIEAETNEGVM